MGREKQVIERRVHWGAQEGPGGASSLKSSSGKKKAEALALDILLGEGVCMTPSTVANMGGSGGKSNALPQRVKEGGLRTVG